MKIYLIDSSARKKGSTSRLLAKKLLENWIYWFVIDFVSVFLFISRELYITAFLFTGYLIIIVFGYLAWKRSMLQTKRG